VFKATAPRTSSVQAAAFPSGVDRLIQRGIEAPSAVCRVLVLDTGYAGDPQIGNPTDTFRAACLAGVIASPGDFEVEDADGNGVLDPFAGHGTFIAGLYGRLAPGAEVTVKRVLHPYGDTDDAEVATALADALAAQASTGPDDPPFHVISMSFCGYCDRDDPPIALATAIRMALMQNQDPGPPPTNTFVIVASAGNDAQCRRTWPASFENVISVGALASNGPAWFTNYGPWVNACAPGVDIVSTFFGYQPSAAPPATARSDDFEGWACWSGTSFSAPIVGAAIASEWMSMADGAGMPRISDVAASLIDRPGLFQYPQLGTVINVR
jgi:hypothetical protein